MPALTPDGDGSVLGGGGTGCCGGRAGLYPDHGSPLSHDSSAAEA